MRKHLEVLTEIYKKLLGNLRWNSRRIEDEFSGKFYLKPKRTSGEIPGGFHEKF